MGILENKSSDKYVESALLYPEQTIQAYVNAAVTLLDISLATTKRPTFSTVYMTMKLLCDATIPTNSYIYLVFPK